MVRAIAYVFLGSFLGSCVETHSCTEIGCVDQASLEFRTETGAWQAGEYTLDIAVDATQYTCSFAIPDDLPSTGSVGLLDCTPRLDAYFQQDATCTEHDNGDSSSQSCTPIPNSHYLDVWIQGTPASATVVMQRDGETIVEESPAFSYTEARPNGPDCEPLCRQATVELSVP